MSSISKGSISIRKKDLQTQKDIAIGFTKLVFAHKATLGDSSIDLTSLVTPTSEMPAFVNPTSAEIAAAKLIFNRKNLTLISSTKGTLMDYASYTVPTSSSIAFNGWTAEDGEFFIGIIDPIVKNGLRTVDASPLIKTGTLTAGDTEFIIGTAFELNKYPNEQTGAILVFVDGVLQARNVGNSPSGEGNYYEMDAGGRVSNTIKFNAAFATDVNIVVISNGLIVSSPSDSRDQVVEGMAAQLDVVIEDLAAVTGNPESRYQAQPNQVDLAAFGNRVYEAEQDIISDEARLDDLEDPTQMSNVLATKLGFKQYISGQVYNNSVNLAVTSSKAGWTCNLGEFIPYQMQDGTWRLKFNIQGTYTAANITNLTVSIAGVTFKNPGTDMHVAIAGHLETTGSITAFKAASTVENTGNVTLVVVSTGNTSRGFFSGDTPLESKPTWAY